MRYGTICCFKNLQGKMQNLVRLGVHFVKILQFIHLLKIILHRRRKYLMLTTFDGDRNKSKCPFYQEYF